MSEENKETVGFDDLSDDEGYVLKNMDKMSPDEIELYLHHVQERIEEIKSNKLKPKPQSESESESEPESKQPEPEAEPESESESDNPPEPKPEPEPEPNSEPEPDSEPYSDSPPPEQPKMKPSKNDRKKIRQYESKVRKVLRDFSTTLAETLEPYKMKYRNATIDKFDMDDVVDIHNSMRSEASLSIEDIIYDMEDEGLDFSDSFYDYVEDYFQRQLQRAEQLVL